MDLAFSKNSVQLFSAWFGRNGSVESFVKEEVRRPPFPCAKITTLPCCSPEEEGIDSERIQRFYERLSREDSIKMQTVIVARNGHIVSRAHFYPYSTDIWHVSYSLAKSLTGLAVGLLYDDGLISPDDRLLDVLKDNIPPAARITHKNTTIHHLLTMQTGVFFNEFGAVTDNDWVRAYLESGVKFKPGTSFEYNSMNTYMLSVIVNRIAGKSMTELLRERIFEPLGIKEIYWEKCPKGYEKGGWGVYYYPDDILKIGLLYLNGGVWEGKRLISEKWIRESTKKQIGTPDETGVYDYGYQVWCKQDRSTFLFNGMFGQNLIVFPRTNIMIATTAGIDETFQNSALYTIVERYFGTPYRPRAHMAPSPEKLAALRSAELGYVMHNSDAYKYRNTDNKVPDINGVYEVQESDGAGLSIMPELFQAVHNCFAEGLKRFTIKIDGDQGVLTTLEGKTEHTLKFGVGHEVPDCVRYDREQILTSSYAYATDDGGLRISVSFTELPNVRYITIRPVDGGVSVKWEEAPGYDFIYKLMDRSFLGKLVLADRKTKAVDADFITKRVKYFLQPTVIMKKVR